MTKPKSPDDLVNEIKLECQDFLVINEKYSPLFSKERGDELANKLLKLINEYDKDNHNLMIAWYEKNYKHQ